MSVHALLPGKHLYIKMTDPGDGTVDPGFNYSGARVWGSRYFTMSYDIRAPSLSDCPVLTNNGSSYQFCAMEVGAQGGVNPWWDVHCQYLAG